MDCYPVLMADILPTGRNREQDRRSTELDDIAQRFTLPLRRRSWCRARFARGARVMGLDDPEAKMSKSATGANHAVALLDPPDKIRKIIMRATTDSNPAVDFEKAGPGVPDLGVS